MARSIFFSHFLRGIRHNDKFWQQWDILFFKFCLIRFLITENPYFQNLFNQHRTVTVCIETSIHEMHYCCRGIGAYKHLSFAILWKVRKQYNPKFGLCCFFLNGAALSTKYIFVQSGLLFVYWSWRPWQPQFFLSTYRF